MRKHGHTLFAIAVIVFLVFFGQGPGVTSGQASCPGLGYYSDNYLRASSENRYVYMSRGVPLRPGNTQLRSYSESLTGTSDVTVAALDPLPPNLQLEERVVTGSVVGRIKYVYFTGTPTTEGEYEIRLRATSPGCDEDTGRVFIRVTRSAEGVQCALSSAGPIESGERGMLSWRITGPATSGSISPALPGNPLLSRSGSGETAPLAEDTTFTLTVNGPVNSSECSTEILVGGTSGDTLQFVRTLLDIPTIYQGGGQGIYDALFFNGRFVFSGSCGVNMSVSGSGGGLWVVKEDGTGSIQEREACIDAGSITNIIYHHALIDGAYLSPDGTRGFVRGNSSWASCVRRGTDPFDSQDCAVFGPGANRAVYYEADGDSRVRVVALSPEDPLVRGNWNTGFTVAGGHVISRPGRQTHIARLPTWRDITTVGTFSPSFGYLDYFIGRETGNPDRQYKVYKAEDGAVRFVQNLPGDPAFIYYTYDYSTTPERLVIYQPSTRNDSTRRFLTYETTESGLRLVEETPIPSGFPTGNPNTAKGGFGAWGDYIVWPDREGFSIWKEGEKIETVRLPEGGTVFNIVVSRRGYVAVTGWHTEGDGRKTAAYLYKIVGATPPPAPPAPSPGDGGGTVDVGGFESKLRSLFDRVRGLQSLLNLRLDVLDSIDIFDSDSGDDFDPFTQ